MDVKRNQAALEDRRTKKLSAPEAPAQKKCRAQYELGSPTRPAIFHDNGHLQNPLDRADPIPLPTTEPTIRDRINLVAWQGLLAGSAVLPELDDARAAYAHFLGADGTPRQVRYAEFLEHDPAGRAIRSAAQFDAVQGAVEIYEQLVAAEPALRGQALDFSLTSSALNPGTKACAKYYPYPATENWQKALGAHALWMSADVAVTPEKDGARFEMKLTLHAEDQYNFNPKDRDLATGLPDRLNGRFEQVGLGKQYLNTGTVVRTVRWLHQD